MPTVHSRGINLLLYHHSPHVIGVSSHGGWVRSVHPPFPARFVRCTDPFEAVVTIKYIADHENGSRLAPELLYATVASVVAHERGTSLSIATASKYNQSAFK